MASVHKIRNEQGKVVSYRVRWRDPDGRMASKSFRTQKEAKAHAASVEATKASGTYVDKRAGRAAFRAYAEEWLKHLTAREGTLETYGSHLRNHIYPTFGEREIGSVERSHIISWVKDRTQHIAPTTLGTVYKVLSMVFRSAVDDSLIVRTPCTRITNLPKVERAKEDAVKALTPEQVVALAAAMPERYRALVILAAGCGLRQGECFGLTVDRVDFLRRTVKVDSQLVMPNSGKVKLAAPKTDASYRTVPLPRLVADALAAHLATFSAGDVEIEDCTGAKPATVKASLIFTTERGHGIPRNRFHERAWSKAIKAAHVPDGTHFHQLRHTYASLLIAHGESPKVIQERLGHSSITETMDTYGHLYPESEESTRAAIDAAFTVDSDEASAVGE